MRQSKLYDTSYSLLVFTVNVAIGRSQIYQRRLKRNVILDV